MKKTLFLSAFICLSSPLMAAVGDTLNLIVDSTYSANGFIADGAKGTGSYFYGGSYSNPDIKTTTRFYDSTKNWSEIISNSAGDSRMCWAHTAGNMLQYWQSYYGVFYKGNYGELPYGTDYTRQVNPSLGASYTITDPMRLNTTKHLITVGFNQSNTGGNVYAGIDYYFCRNQSGGGYFSEYFGSFGNGVSIPSGQTSTVTVVNSQENLTPALLSALGITKQGDGTYKQTEAGLIAHLNVGADTGNTFSAHTLTCYGLTLDENGNVKSIIYADSDNYKLSGIASSEGIGTEYGGLPSMEQAYVKVVDGKILLYTDAACETPLTYGTENHYYLGAVTQINTPEVLKNMLAEYSDVANEAQVWNGNSNEWKAQVATTEELPTESTGWDVLVDGDNIAEEHRDYYHAYSTDGRAVVFGAHGMNGRTSTQTITVSGTVTPGAITVENGGDYHLKADTGAAIEGTGDVAVNNGGKLSSELNFGTRAIKVASGGHFAYAMTADTVLTGQISGESGSTIQFRNGSSATDVTYSYDTTNFRLASTTVNAITGTLVIGDSQDTMATHVDFSAAYDGYMNVENLVMYGTSSLNTAGTTVVTGTYSSLKSLQAASTYNLRAAATPGPTLYDSLDLTQADTLVMETSTSLSYNSLILSTSNSLTLDMELSTTEANILFTEVGQVAVDGIANTGETEWEASSFFSGADMQNYNLVYSDGTVALVFDPLVPEPATSTLGLVALAGLAMRRRRR